MNSLYFHWHLTRYKAMYYYSIHNLTLSLYTGSQSSELENQGTIQQWTKDSKNFQEPTSYFGFWSSWIFWINSGQWQRCKIIKCKIMPLQNNKMHLLILYLGCWLKYGSIKRREGCHSQVCQVPRCPKHTTICER